jgi:site-specific DNA-methyltransferase (adenine-specific)
MPARFATPRTSAVHLADCLDFLPTLEDNSIDLLLTDPPYGNNYLSRSHKLPLVRIANNRSEAIPLIRTMLRLVYPKLKDNGVGLMFCDWKSFSSMKAVIEEEGYLVTNVLIWKKNAWTRGDLKGDWGYGYEVIIFFRKKNLLTKLRRFLNGKRDGNVLEFKKLATNKMAHPTEKPPELLKYLIEKTTQPGEVVLDPFMGVGGVVVAAQELDRVGIGAEIEKIWAEKAAERTGLPLLTLALGE